MLHSESYGYDAASNILTRAQNGVSTTFTYDALHQLLSESRAGYAASYTYDANGNRESRTVNGLSETYTLDAGDKLTLVSWPGGSRSYSYDGAGRCTQITPSSGPAISFGYDVEGRITSATRPGMSANAYGYNGVGARVSKSDSGGSTSYKRAGVSVTSPVLSDGDSSFTPGVSSRTGSTTTYAHGGLKSAVLQTSSSQAPTATREYDAFGNLMSSSGTWSGPFAYGGPFGYQSDADTGLMLLGHRYYDPSIGRFLTRDRIKDGRNWYAYCAGNPVSWEDSDGRSKRKLIAYLYALVVRDTGTLLKYGKWNGKYKRYPNKYLDDHNADFGVICKGTNAEMLEQERMMIKNGDGGPLNKEWWNPNNQLALAPAIPSIKELVEMLDPTFVSDILDGTDCVGKLVMDRVYEAQDNRRRAAEWWLSDES